MMGIARWVRKGVLKVWEKDPAVQAMVLDVRRSAWHPRSRMVRLTAKTGADRRVVQTIIPNNIAPDMRKGDALWLIMPARKPRRSLVAMLYE